MEMRLEVHIFISSLDERGFTQSGGLEIREQVVVSADTFLEAAKILGQFHDLAQALGKK